MQGLLVQALERLDREARGLSLRGRKEKCKDSDTRHRLVQDAAMSLAVLGGNKTLCVELGQAITPPRVRVDMLPERGLPNPALSLMSSEQLEENMTLVDQHFPRSPEMKSRRLIVAMDATYLTKSLSQMSLKGKVGLVGACWSPQDESQALLPLNSVSKCANKAPVIMEMIAWDPCAKHLQTFSIASMPMGLAAPQQDGTSTLTHLKNLEPGIE